MEGALLVPLLIWVALLLLLALRLLGADPATRYVIVD
jgi:hypothetical protein